MPWSRMPTHRLAMSRRKQQVWILCVKILQLYMAAMAIVIAEAAIDMEAPLSNSIDVRRHQQTKEGLVSSKTFSPSSHNSSPSSAPSSILSNVARQHSSSRGKPVSVSWGGVEASPATRSQPRGNSVKKTATESSPYCNSSATSEAQDEANPFDKLSNSRTVHYVDKAPCQPYHPWSPWRPCNRKCQQVRTRRCRAPARCGRRKLRERRNCRRRGGVCVPLRSVGRSLEAVGERQPRQRAGQREMTFLQLLYGAWSPWGRCSRACRQRRRRRCALEDLCRDSYIQESRACGEAGTKCHRLMMKRKQTRPRKEKEREEDDGDNDDDAIIDDEGEEEEEGKGYNLHVDGPPDHGPTEDYRDVEDAVGLPGPRPHRKRKQEDRKEAGEVTEADAADKSYPDQSDDTEAAEDISAAGLLTPCGLRPPDTRGSFRVIGGQESQRLSWPWQVALLTRWNEQYCGGTLVAPQWVLTAAHCVRKKGRRRRFIVRVGEHNLQEFEGSEDDILPEVEFPHPDFDHLTITNDIALVRLREPLPDFAHPGYACLPGESFTPDRDAMCHILGWGKRKNTHKFGADSLFEVQVPIVKHKRCQKVFHYDINNHTQLCAGYRRGGRDACAGDSGGPLLCPATEQRTGQTRWYLAGITSYGEGCGRRGKFGIYTRVASYRPWIAATLRQYLDHRANATERALG